MNLGGNGLSGVPQGDFYSQNQGNNFGAVTLGGGGDQDYKFPAEWSVFGIPPNPERKYKNFQYPKAHEGEVQLLANIITASLIANNLSFILSERSGIPIVRVDQQHFTWTEVHMDVPWLSIVPEEGVSDTFRSSYQEHHATVVRRGVSGYVEDGFMHTPMGQQYLVLMLQRMETGTLYTYEMVALNAMLSHRSTHYQKLQNEMFIPTEYRQMCKQWALEFDAGQKSEVLLTRMVIRMKEILSRKRGFPANGIYAQSRGYSYLGFMGAKRLEYYLAGPAGPDRMNQNPWEIDSFAGLPVYYLEDFKDGGDIIYPLDRPRQFGHFYLIHGQDPESIVSEKYRSTDMSIEILNLDKERYDRISLKQAFEHCRAFGDSDNEGKYGWGEGNAVGDNAQLGGDMKFESGLSLLVANVTADGHIHYAEKLGEIHEDFLPNEYIVAMAKVAQHRMGNRNGNGTIVNGNGDLVQGAFRQAPGAAAFAGETKSTWQDNTPSIDAKDVEAYLNSDHGRARMEEVRTESGPELPEGSLHTFARYSVTPAEAPVLKASVLSEAEILKKTEDISHIMNANFNKEFEFDSKHVEEMKKAPLSGETKSAFIAELHSTLTSGNKPKIQSLLKEIEKIATNKAGGLKVMQDRFVPETVVVSQGAPEQYTVHEVDTLKYRPGVHFHDRYNGYVRISTVPAAAPGAAPGPHRYELDGRHMNDEEDFDQINRGGEGRNAAAGNFNQNGVFQPVNDNAYIERRGFGANTYENDICNIKLTRGNLKALIDRDVPFPFGFMIAQPFVQTMMASLLIGHFGRDLGFFAQGPSKMMFGPDVAKHTHSLHYTTNGGPVIQRPECLAPLDDVWCKEYIGGMNGTFFDEESWNHVKNGQFKVSAREFAPSVISFIVPINVHKTIDTIIDIRGKFTTDSDTDPLHFVTVGSAHAQYGFPRGIVSNNFMSAEDVETNTVLFQGHQRNWDPATKSYTSVTVGASPFGINCYPKMRDVLDGNLGQYNIFKDMGFEKFSNTLNVR